MNLAEIKTIISELPTRDLADLSVWLEELQANAWDYQIADDVKAGRFAPILKRVDEQAETGQCRLLK